METVTLGATGLKVSRLCLGCMTFGATSWREWVLDEAASRPIVARAFELGVNFFDTADVYSLGASEEITGKLLPEFAPRHDYVLATKVFSPMGEGANNRGLSRKHIMESIDASLRRLRTDYVDLYQIHRFDHATPLEETLEALHDVVRAGKALYLGASSMHAWQFMKALGLQRRHGWAPFVSMQNHYNLMYREEKREMLPLCRSEGIGVIPWSPLARGHLAGNKRRADGAGDNTVTARARSDDFARQLYGTPADAAVIEAVRNVAARLGRSMPEVAYAWVASRPAITAPIVGISRVDQFDAAAKALDVELSADDVAELEAPYVVRGVAGHE